MCSSDLYVGKEVCDYHWNKWEDDHTDKLRSALGLPPLKRVDPPKPAPEKVPKKVVDTKASFLYSRLRLKLTKTRNPETQ